MEAKVDGEYDSWPGPYGLRGGSCGAPCRVV
jgi:hypothetical protein